MSAEDSSPGIGHVGDMYLRDVGLQLRKYKDMADKAIAQTRDEHFFAALDAENNSIALKMKHTAGNMRSRWTNFLTSDGEKPDRLRDSEFVIEEGESRESVTALWEDGWRLTFSAIEPLGADDLLRVVSIRGEPHTVMEAINRQLTHYSYHVGQIVLLAKHFAGEGWQCLSIPRGRSADFDVSKKGGVYSTGYSGRTGGADTDAAMLARYLNGLRAIPKSQRLARAMALSALARDMAWQGATRHSGHLGARAVAERFLLQLYGPAIARQAVASLARDEAAGESP